MTPRARALLSDLSLVLVTLVWGTTFPILKQLLVWVPPMSFAAVRFSLATAALLLVGARGVARMRRSDWMAALWLGAALFAGLGFQLQGLRLTSPTHSAFLTSLSVPLTPFAAILVLRSRPKAAAWLGCALAFTGALALTYQPGLLLGRGDLLTVACAVAWAFEIALVARLIPGKDAIAIATAMCAVCAALAWLAAFAFHEQIPALGALPWGATAWVGIVAGGIPLIVQNWAQKHTTPVHVALIYSLEPLWAALFCYLWLGQSMGPRAWLGSGLILAGIVVAEVWPEA